MMPAESKLEKVENRRGVQDDRGHISRTQVSPVKELPLRHPQLYSL